ncbi:methyl-accepting chemotaxis protein [Radiobacillus deserti]|uniref:HAMP domain-containing protein n=1 Tax=Radiobacillus deserti TaxID=2594883 RepID=A0A516KDS6_9BACI|nr:HAMP domain-containing protein [Radiobacillus deserti]QDP39551.1 HAMP domain-containing protein [Radiobacillus deserti]
MATDRELGNKFPSLKKQFTIRIIVLLLVIAVAFASFQVFLIHKHTHDSISREIQIISKSIEYVIQKNDLATKELEKQLDYRLVRDSYIVAERLTEGTLQSVTNGELVKWSRELGIAGINLWEIQQNDIVNISSTNPENVGLQLRQQNPFGDVMMRSFLNGAMTGETTSLISYKTDDVVVLKFNESITHSDTPEHYKNAYYNVPGTKFLINPFLEVDNFETINYKVGHAEWFSEIKQSSDYVHEIAIIDPSILKKGASSLQEVVCGEYTFQDNKDIQIIQSMIKDGKRKSYSETYNGKEIYKSFLPMEDGNVIYIALRYSELKNSEHFSTVVLVLSGIISLSVLVLYSTGFFSSIYSNIQKVRKQILKLENGDFTARNVVTSKNEIGELSNSVNKMASSLNDVLVNTYKHAVKTECHAYLLETETNKTVDKVYNMSIDYTSTARETIAEVTYLFDHLEEFLNQVQTKESALLIGQIQAIKQLIGKQSDVTTNMTITLSDLIQSLTSQSSSLSEISRKLMDNIDQFRLNHDNIDE